MKTQPSKSGWMVGSLVTVNMHGTMVEGRIVREPMSADDPRSWAAENSETWIVDIDGIEVEVLNGKVL